MSTPSHRNRTSQQILRNHIYHDALGFGFRAASWLDLLRRTNEFAAFHYACIDARLAIEHLIFEQIVITSGEALTPETYARCVAQPRKLKKLLDQINPDYEKLQAFTNIVCSLSPGFPPVNQWNVKTLMKSWGTLSSYLHWSGAHSETTEDPNWQEKAILAIANIIDPLWQKLSSAHSGCVPPKTMKPAARQVWDDFREGRIDEKAARIRLESTPPFLRGDHA